MAWTPDDIEGLYQAIRLKKQEEGKTYTKEDFIRDLGLKRQGTYSDWVSGRRQPSGSVQAMMDVLENRELG